MLDNFEHVLDAAPVLAALLARAPRLQILATSRAVAAPLRRTRLCPAPGRCRTATPAAVPSAARGEAVATLRRACPGGAPTSALTQANAPAVAEVCARLDGLPLAIELAAARVAACAGGPAGPAGAAPSAPDRRRPRPARPASGRCATPSPGATTCSPPDEQALFRRLAVFAGGFSLEAAEAVAGEEARNEACSPQRPGPPRLDGLLVDQSLVQPANEPGRRAALRHARDHPRVRR